MRIWIDFARVEEERKGSLHCILTVPCVPPLSIVAGDIGCIVVNLCVVRMDWSNVFLNAPKKFVRTTVRTCDLASYSLGRPGQGWALLLFLKSGEKLSNGMLARLHVSLAVTHEVAVHADDTDLVIKRLPEDQSGQSFKQPQEQFLITSLKL